MEKRYSEIELNPAHGGLPLVNKKFSQDVEMQSLKENIIERAERAQQELRNYFAKLEANGSNSSSDSTAEDCTTS